MNRLIAAPLRCRWLAALAATAALLATSAAVEPYRLRKEKLRNEPLPEEKSLKEHKLTPYRAKEVSPFLPRKHDFPYRYTRKNEGTKRMSR